MDRFSTKPRELFSSKVGSCWQSSASQLAAAGASCRKKGAPSRTCACQRRRYDKGHHRRATLTVAGLVYLERLYLRCPKGGGGNFPLDERLGISGSISPRAQRLVCLAGTSWSFDKASGHLQEFCGLQVSDTTIRQVCQQHGA